MNKENINLWVAALKSGEYAQGRDGLRLGDNYCCLGVACDVYHKATGKGEWKAFESKDELFQSFEINGADHSSSVLPNAVAAWYGISRVGRFSMDNHLAVLNDAKGLDFKSIANFIETHPTELTNWAEAVPS